MKKEAIINEVHKLQRGVEREDHSLIMPKNQCAPLRGGIGSHGPPQTLTEIHP